MRRASRGSRPVILHALEVALVVAFVVALEVVVVVVLALEPFLIGFLRFRHSSSEGGAHVIDFEVKYPYR